MKTIKIKLIVSLIAVIMIASVSFAGWGIVYETDYPQSKSGSIVPSRGIPMFRVYQGTLKVTVDSYKNEMVVLAESYSHDRGQARAEEGYLFALFFKKAPCVACDGKGRINYRGKSERCIQCSGSGNTLPTGDQMSKYVISTEDQFVPIDGNGSIKGSIAIPSDAEYALFFIYRSRGSSNANNSMERALREITGYYGRMQLRSLCVKRQ